MAKGFTEGYKTYDTSKGFGNSQKWQDSFEERLHLKSLSPSEKEENADILKPLFAAHTKEELKMAYYALMNKYHPDKAGDTALNNTLAQLINETYFSLKSKHL